MTESLQPVAVPALVGAASAASVAVGFFISEVALPWFWEDRRERRELNAVHQRFREPLCLAARELASRTTEILENYLSGAKPYPPKFLRRKNLAVTASRQELTTDKDPYFVRYKLISTLYRFCAFCGWIELYRQELTFLRAANSKKTRALRAAIQAIRTDLADGHLNEADNWPDWRDLLILREEQRAVGEAMLEERGDKRVVVGYGRFCELLEAAEDSMLKTWALRVAEVFFRIRRDQDFRNVRLMRLGIHLIDLVELLDAELLDDRLNAARSAYSALVFPNQTTAA